MSAPLKKHVCVNFYHNMFQMALRVTYGSLYRCMDNTFPSSQEAETVFHPLQTCSMQSNKIINTWMAYVPADYGLVDKWTGLGRGGIAEFTGNRRTTTNK